jgi:hypothetical protein
LLGHSRNRQDFKEHQGSLPWSQEPAIFPYLESNKSSPNPPVIFLKILFNSILPSISFHSEFIAKILYAFLLSSIRTTCPVYVILPDFIILIIFRLQYKLQG